MRTRNSYHASRRDIVTHALVTSLITCFYGKVIALRLDLNVCAHERACVYETVHDQRIQQLLRRVLVQRAQQTTYIDL